MAEDQLAKKLVEFVRDQVDKMDIRPTFGEVVSVDENARTVEVKPDDGPEVESNIQAKQESNAGLALVPEVGSRVIVGFLSEDYAYVVATSKVKKYLLDCDEVTVNGGDNGGIPITPDVVERLNNVEKDINKIKQIFAAWSPVSQDGGAALKTASATWYNQQLQTTTEQDIEDTKFKH